MVGYSAFNLKEPVVMPGNDPAPLLHPGGMDCGAWPTMTSIFMLRGGFAVS